GGTPGMEFRKRGGNREVGPAGPPERAPSTSFDVDLYEPRAGDTYESISREFYNDTRYAAALREFNKGQPLQGGKQVEVPPIHVLRKRFPQLVGTNPAAMPGPAPAARPTSISGTAPDWGTPGAAEAPTFRASGSQTFRVPAGGMTMPAIAKLTLGSEQRWSEIWELNKSITAPGEPLPAGTEVKLPPGAKLPG